MSLFSRSLAVAGLVVAAGLIGYFYSNYNNVAPPAQNEPAVVSQAAPDREATREIIREYLLERPEVLEEAMIALRTRRQEEKRARTQAAIADNRAVLLSHEMSPVSGNPDGDVTLVEFFDYACGYCKRSLSVMMNLLKGDPQLRIVVERVPGARAGVAYRGACLDGGRTAGALSGVPRGGHGNRRRVERRVIARYRRTCRA